MIDIYFKLIFIALIHFFEYLTNLIEKSKYYKITYDISLMNEEIILQYLKFFVKC